MRKLLALTLGLLIALGAGAALPAESLPAPAPEQTLMACDVVHFADGSCSTICTFTGPKGENQGYIVYNWC